MGSAAGNNEASEVLVSEAHDALDTDSDGKVTKEEFMTAHKERYNSQLKRALQKAAMLDKTWIYYLVHILYDSIAV